MQYVQATKEFHRIKNLPRRVFDPTNSDLLAMIKALTEYLKTPQGTQLPYPIQAFVLQELYEHRGFIGSLPVGGGKTLITALAPTLLEAQRPVLIIPAKHQKQKTPRDFEKLKQHWRIRDDITLLSYEKIGVVSGKDILFKLQPDLLILDEMNYVKNRKGVARTKRIERYVRKHRPIILGLSGTFINNTILQAWHLLYWALPYTMPLPRKWHEVKMWSDAAENDPYFTGVHPGVLTEFCTLTEDITDAIGRRIVETPGVVALNRDDALCTLTITADYPEVPQIIKDAVEKLREDWETPCGEPFSYELQRWNYARTLGCGLYYTWKYPPPKEWIVRKKEWSTVCREALKYSRTLDSRKQVALAALAGKLPSEWTEVYERWSEVRPIYKPVTVPIWLSEYLVDYAMQWMNDNDRGIVWCEIKAFCERLAEKSGRPYFCNDGCTSDGLFIEDFKGPCIASPKAVKDGYNLQYNWSDNLMISYPPNKETLEQVLGRTHRKLQTEDEVTVKFVFTVQETVDGFKKAVAEAKLYTTVLESKLLYADYVDMGFEVL